MWKEIGILGDIYKSMGSALVYINDVKVGTIDKLANEVKLKKASRSYRQLLFVERLKPGKETKQMKIKVDTGDIILDGLADEKPAGPGVSEKDYGFSDDPISPEDQNIHQKNDNSPNS